MLVANPFVGHHQIDVDRYCIADILGEGVGTDILHNAGYHAPFAFHSTCHDGFPGATSGAANAAFVLVTVLCLAADECLVNFNLSLQRAVERTGAGGVAETVHHEPS